MLEPAPQPTLSRAQPEEKAGRPFAATTTLTLRGTLIAHMGSPNSLGVFWTGPGSAPEETIAADSRHTAILAKQKALETLLRQQNQILEFVGWDGVSSRKFVARLQRIEFAEGYQWHTMCPWTATFDVDEQGIVNDGIESLSESWQTEIQDENLGLYRIVHTVNARGRAERDATGALTKLAWEQARDFAISTVGLGLDAGMMNASGVLNAFSLTGYNYLRGQSADVAEGTFSVTETWTGFDPAGGAAATHSQTVTKRASISGEVTVSIDGEIQGLRGTDNSTYQTTSQKSTNANARWALVEPTLYASATGWYGSVLNSAPLSYSVQENVTAGSISYSREFSNRASDLAVGSVSERVEIRDSAAGSLYAALPVVGRVLGPVMQDMGSQTARRRTLSIEIQMPAKTATFTPTAPDTDAYTLSRAPSATYVFLDQDEYSFDEYSGRYSRQTVWSYTN